MGPEAERLSIPVSRRTPVIAPAYFKRPSNFDGGDGPEPAAASLVRATGVEPNSPAKRSISSAASATILTSGLRRALLSADLTDRPCMFRIIRASASAAIRH